MSSEHPLHARKSPRRVLRFNAGRLSRWEIHELGYETTAVNGLSSGFRIGGRCWMFWRRSRLY